MVSHFLKGEIWRTSAQYTAETSPRIRCLREFYRLVRVTALLATGNVILCVTTHSLCEPVGGVEGPLTLSDTRFAAMELWCFRWKTRSRRLSSRRIHFRICNLRNRSAAASSVSSRLQN